MMFRLVALVVVAVLVVPPLWAPGRASACSCLGVSGEETRVRAVLDSADLVVVARVPYVGPVDDYGFSLVPVDVERVYKGDPPKRIRVQETDMGLGCGYEFGAEGRYLLALRPAREVQGAYEASLCSAFVVPAAGEADDERAAFMRTLDQVAVARSPSRGRDVRYWLVVPAAAGMVVLAAATALVLRRGATR